MKGRTIISGNFLIAPLLTGIILLATACFTIVTDETRRSNQGINFIPQDPEEVGDSPASRPSSSSQDSDSTYELELIAEPSDAAEFVVTPKPDTQGAYLAGTTVTIDVLSDPGWEVEQWVGPVYAISGDVAKVNMEHDQIVLVRMAPADPIAVPAVTSGATPAATP